MSLRLEVLRAESPELAAALDGAENAGCPFCGELIVISCPTRMVLHVLPQCSRFVHALASVNNFDAAVVLLATSTVQA